MSLTDTVVTVLTSHLGLLLSMRTARPSSCLSRCVIKRSLLVESESGTLLLRRSLKLFHTPVYRPWVTLMPGINDIARYDVIIFERQKAVSNLPLAERVAELHVQSFSVQFSTS